MSLNLVRKVNAKHPHLLLTNNGESCNAFLDHLIEELRAAGLKAYRVCKTAGEKGQYTPLGFQPRLVKGFDGNDYMITGLSHDAVWCEGLQFDVIGGAHFGPMPFGAPGNPMWDPIPREHWRPNNPPLTGNAVIVNPRPPTPPPAPSFSYPDEATAVFAFQNRVKAAYRAVGRKFPDEEDADAFRHFTRYGFSCRGMAEPEAANKHIKELRQELGAPAE